VFENGDENDVKSGLEMGQKVLPWACRSVLHWACRSACQKKIYFL